MSAFLLTIWRVFPAKVWAIAAILIAALTLFGVARCEHDRAERAEAGRLAAETELRAAKDRFRADANAADERLTDAINNQATREELSNAVRDLPDARPSDRRLALACARLRRQGTPDADLPAVCGSVRGAQAGS